MNKLWLWGGGAVAAVALGAFILTRGTAPVASSDASADTGLGSYFPPLVYGSGGSVAGADPGGLNASDSYSTDNSISQLIASQLATATIQSETTKYTAGLDRDVALAGYASDQAIALDTNKTDIQKALAAQLTGVVNAFTNKSSTSKSSSGFLGIGGSGSSNSTTTGPNSIVGSIGFDNGKINIDIAKNVGAGANSNSVKKVA